MDYRKLYEQHHNLEIPKEFDVHHIDWNHDNNDIDNLIAIPKEIHKLVHSNLGYVNRGEFEVLLKKYDEIINSKTYKGKTLTTKYLKALLDKYVKYKKCDLGLKCRAEMHYRNIRYFDTHDY